MLLPLVTAAANLAAAIVERIPEPDPELRRLRVEHRAALAKLREEHRQERWRAREARRAAKR